MSDAHPTPTKPGRSPFRLSLRTWLIAMTIAIVLVGWQSRRAVLTPRNLARMGEVARLDREVLEIAWSPDRDRIAVLGWEEPAEIRDALSLRKNEEIGTKLIHFAFSPDRDIVASCENGRSAEILDRRTGRTIALDAKNDQPRMAFSPDGKHLATGGYGTIVRLWRVSDGMLVREFDAGPVVGGLTAAFSPDGKTLAVGNRNSTSVLFDVATGRLRARLPKQCSQGLQFSPDGWTLAVAYVDGSVALWDPADGRLLQQRKTTAEELYQVDWSPDGQILATSGLRGKITLWDPEGLAILREIDGPEWVIGLRFSPDGRNLITAGGGANVGAKDRHLTVWGIEGKLYTIANRR